MRVHPIFHSGFLVETAQSHYLFDYYRGALPPIDTDKPVVVFCSHAHGDHFNPAVFDLLRERGVRRITAVLARDIAQRKYPPETEVLRAYANKVYDLPGGEVLHAVYHNCRHRA